MKKIRIPRKRPCRICRKWFMPDPRVVDRQKTCGSEECKRQWHKRKCAEWNKKNSEYFKANYLAGKLTYASGHDQKPKASNEVGSNLDHLKPRINLKLPRNEVQEVIGLQTLVIIEYIAQLLLRRVQEVMIC